VDRIEKERCVDRAHGQSVSRLPWPTSYIREEPPSLRRLNQEPFAKKVGEIRMNAQRCYLIIVLRSLAAGVHRVTAQTGVSPPSMETNMPSDIDPQSGVRYLCPAVRIWTRPGAATARARCQHKSACPGRTRPRTCPSAPSHRHADLSAGSDEREIGGWTPLARPVAILNSLGK
jgi:hypothetical protein